MKRLKLFIPLFIFAGLSLLFWRGLDLDPTEIPSALVGRSIPEFRMPTVLEPERYVSQEDIKNHGHDYALINVWGTWCGPCRQEHPFLVELANRGIPIFGVNARDDLGAAQEWLQQKGDPYVFSVFDPNGELDLDLGVYGYPETFLIDSNGTVLFRKVSVLSQQVWERDFLPIINGLSK